MVNTEPLPHRNNLKVYNIEATKYPHSMALYCTNLARNLFPSHQLFFVLSFGLHFTIHFLLSLSSLCRLTNSALYGIPPYLHLLNYVKYFMSLYFSYPAFALFISTI